MSRETESFAADVYINGIKRASAHNDGSGGPTSIIPYTTNDNNAVSEAEKYAKSLPSTMFNGIELKSDLDFVISDLLNKHLIEKEFKKDMNKGLLYDVTEEGYRIFQWKGLTISKMLKSQIGIAAIKKAISDLKEKGKIVINTNIPAEFFA